MLKNKLIQKKDLRGGPGVIEVNRGLICIIEVSRYVGKKPNTQRHNPFISLEKPLLVSSC